MDPGWAASWPCVRSSTHSSKDVLPSLTHVRSSRKSAITCSHNYCNCSVSAARHFFSAVRVCDSSASASILAESSECSLQSRTFSASNHCFSACSPSTCFRARNGFEKFGQPPRYNGPLHLPLSKLQHSKMYIFDKEHLQGQDSIENE